MPGRLSNQFFPVGNKLTSGYLIQKITQIRTKVDCTGKPLWVKSVNDPFWEILGVIRDGERYVWGHRKNRDRDGGASMMTYTELQRMRVKKMAAFMT